MFQGLQERYSGFTEMFSRLASAADSADLGTTFTEFALAADAAGLSGEELNAVANELGDTLGQVLSGEELGKVIAEFVSRFEEFKGALEGVVPGIEDLQIEADSFSLHNFIHELERIGEARRNVLANIDTLLNDFGALGQQALEALISSGLNPEQFALAVDQAIEGGEETLQEIADRFADISGPELDALAQRLVASGFNEDTVNEILGLDAFSAGVTELEGLTGDLDAASAAFFDRLGDFQTAIDNAPNPWIAGLIQGGRDKFAAEHQEEAAVPGIDVQAATAEAVTAGEQIGAALASSAKTAVDAGFVQLTPAATAAVTSLSDALAGPAAAAGRVTGVSFHTGFLGNVQNLAVSTTAAVSGLGKTLSGPAAAAGIAAGRALGGGYGFASLVSLSGAFAVNRTVMQASGLLLQAQAGRIGVSAATSFGQGLDRLSVLALVEMVQASQAVGTGGVILTLRAGGVGSAAASAFASGLNLPAVVSAQLAVASLQFNAAHLRNVAYFSGLSVGASFGAGLADGIASSRARAAASAAALVAATVRATRDAAVIASPSKVFAAQGLLMGEGLASGLLSAIPALVSAARTAVAAAAGAASGGVSVPASVSGLAASPGAAQALRRLSLDSPGRGAPAAQQAAAAGGDVHYHTWNIDAPTDDPETLAVQVATRIERRVRR
jgi:hypothetical protein